MFTVIMFCCVVILRTKTIQEASELKATGADVIAIGIGSATDAYELQMIGSDASHVFNVLSFDYLDTIQQQILQEACAGESKNYSVY